MNNAMLLKAQTETYYRDLFEHLFKHGGDFKEAAADVLAAATTAGIAEYDTKRIFA